MSAFLHAAGANAGQSYGHTCELALGVLAEAGYDMVKALVILRLIPRQLLDHRVMETWTNEETARFEEGYGQHGKRFHLVQAVVKTRTTGQVVRFYYHWKVSERHYQWKVSGSMAK